MWKQINFIIQNLSVFEDTKAEACKRQPKEAEQEIWEASPVFSPIKRLGTEGEGKVNSYWTLSALVWRSPFNGEITQVYG